MSSWSLTYDQFDPEHEPLREALTTLGNGYFSTRGAGSENSACKIHYPATYLAGGYNRLTSTVANQEITNEDFVNWPNWLLITFRHRDSDWFDLDTVKIINYQQTLNLQHGVLERTVRFCDNKGFESTVKSRRIVHMANPHFGAIEYSITAHNWAGPILIRTSLDGAVINDGVERYRELSSKHLSTIACGETEEGNMMFLQVETNQSHIQMAQVARHQFFCEGKSIEATPTLTTQDESVSQTFTLDIQQNQTLTMEKTVAIYTSKDSAISECLYDATVACLHADSFPKLLKSHKLAWQFLWHRADIKIEVTNTQAINEQLIIRLHIFHLLQSVSLNSIGLDVGIPARGLHGEAYRGNIFWDELFIFPFYSYHTPEITRSLLLYRYNRLNMARISAQKAGFNGAMFPWQSGSNGQEETQLLHLNPQNNTWGPDLSHYQYHVNAAIAYNIWQYHRLTGDIAFLSQYGAEMILEIAKFWASVVQFNKQSGRYEILNVVGPDEYHERYPDSDAPGINNNAYTNVLAVWVLERAMQVLEILSSDHRKELMLKLNITLENLNYWDSITKKMLVPFHDGNIISQFEGYEQLQEFQWDAYHKKYGNIERLDRILKAENDSPNHYKLSKQADVLMLFYLLPQEELSLIFEKLGYEQFDDACIHDTIQYYQRRTSHGSTLSRVVFASELGTIDKEAALSHFEKALVSDISDTQGGTTHEGIHLGAMAGTIDIVMRQFSGIRVDADGLQFNPDLPKYVQSIALRLQYQGSWYHVEVNHDEIKLTLEPGLTNDVTVYVNNEKVLLEANSTRRFTSHG